LQKATAKKTGKAELKYRYEMMLQSLVFKIPNNHQTTNLEFGGAK